MSSQTVPYSSAVSVLTQKERNAKALRSYCNHFYEIGLNMSQIRKPFCFARRGEADVFCFTELF